MLKYGITIILFALLSGWLGLTLYGVYSSEGKNSISVSDLLIPTWTRSYQLYGQPHALWLSDYDTVGTNLPLLNKIIAEAERQHKRFEIVIYGIPFRDMGQSSGGGFDTFEDYLADNQLNAKAVGDFVKRTGIQPRVYLEPDALAHAIQYREDRQSDPVSVAIYEKRIQAMQTLIQLYQSHGALVYLDTAHSDWFDYSDHQIKAMAMALNRAGIKKADGLVTNVSNRQPVTEKTGLARTTGRSEVHYLRRLLPRLENKHLDVVVDTSRNGGTTHQRHYLLKDNNQLMDNESPEGRLVGSWSTDETGERWVKPFFGPPMKFSVLTGLDKYTFSETTMTLSAPPWLDAVGDVQLGEPPTDKTGIDVIQKFRYIKPPDDCDGSLNCPPGWSKHDLNKKTQKPQALAGFQ